MTCARSGLSFSEMVTNIFATVKKRNTAPIVFAVRVFKLQKDYPDCVCAELKLHCLPDNFFWHNFSNMTKQQ